MHELAVVRQLVQLVEEQARLAKAEKVIAVHLSLGEQSHLASASLETLFAMFSADASCASGASLQITRLPMTFFCATCANDYPVSQASFACPYCQQVGVIKDLADQLSLESLEVI